MDTLAPSGLSVGRSDFWRRPLAARMADFAGLRREHGPLFPVELEGFVDDVHPFWAVIGHTELVEVSRRPQLYCSGQGSIAIQDMPEQAMEFFGSFINMDDPRHARLRGIVSRSFTPRRLQEVQDSVERICAELIDAMCEKGEVDLVEALSAPFPLFVICDMMGIPRSQFHTVLEATNIILGAGDPEMLGGRDPFTALFEAGMTLTGLMGELATERRTNPTDDLTSALIHADVEGEFLRPEELGPFFILLAVAGNDTTRTATSLGMHLLGEFPDQRRAWQEDLEGLTPGAVDEIVRYASPVTFMRRTVTEDTELAGHALEAGDKVVLFYGAANRDPAVFPDPDRFDVRRDSSEHVGFGGPGPHFCLGAHLARRELSIAFRQLLRRLPDIEPAGPPIHLEANGIPLVGGVKHLPVRFTPTAPLGTD